MADKATGMPFAQLCDAPGFTHKKLLNGWQKFRNAFDIPSQSGFNASLVTCV